MKKTTTRFANKARGLRGRRVAAMLRGSLLAVLLTAVGLTRLHAGGLLSNDGISGDSFGNAVSFSGGSSLIGARTDDNSSTVDEGIGSAYLFRNITSASGTIFQNVKLIASDGMFNDNFGHAVSFAGNIALVGTPGDDIGVNETQGSAYVFRNLDTATGTITQNAKLIASDGKYLSSFGNSVSLVGTTGLVGASKHDNNFGLAQGAAYLFRNLDKVTGTVTQDVKLIGSDSVSGDYFGSSVSLFGNNALIGAEGDTIGTTISRQGSAYFYRNLDTATGTISQQVKMIANDGADFDAFGCSVSLSGNSSLVGARGDDFLSTLNRGSAYFYRNLETATGTIIQDVKLIATDGTNYDNFGNAVSLSGNTGLVGAYGDSNGAIIGQGSAYLFLNLETKSGTITQNVKLFNTDGTDSDRFGESVTLAGDEFIIGAPGKLAARGKAYSGSVSSFTTLDAGNTSKIISQISFISQDDWIIGQMTDANQVTLSGVDTATVNASGKKVIIGQNPGSDNNRLIIAGTLTATQILVGTSGNSGNVLQIGNGGTNGGSTGALSTGSVITNHGMVIFNRFLPTTQGVHFGTAAITGTGSVTQAGMGTTTFNTAHLYSGDTIIKVGTLKLDLAGGIPNSTRIIVGDAGSSNAKLDVTTKTGGFTVGAAQTLLGIGQIDGNTLILGKHAPGNSPGLQSMNGNLGYGGGSQLDWELAANVSSDSLGLRGMNFDGVDVMGAGVLTIQAGVTSNLIFNAAGSTVDWNNAFWDSDHTWLVYDNTNAPTLASGSIFETINVSADSLGATLTDGAFSWSKVGNDLHLNYTVIPEPSTWVLGALSLLGLSFAGWRKKTKRGAEF